MFLRVSYAAEFIGSMFLFSGVLCHICSGLTPDYAYISFLVVYRGSYVVLGTSLGQSCMYKTTGLPPILSVWLENLFLFIDREHSFHCINVIFYLFLCRYLIIHK